jgi:hypothetical protein
MVVHDIAEDRRAQEPSYGRHWTHLDLKSVMWGLVPAVAIGSTLIAILVWVYITDRQETRTTFNGLSVSLTAVADSVSEMAKSVAVLSVRVARNTDEVNRLRDDD